ncbi:MAG TPA: type II secretion system protein, partial [Verrucomicrobiae bacterium]|nr:type II secretion system protein [Verrucomicrobiae bacterium]
MNRRDPAETQPDGFTVVELLVTVSIIALLATLLFSGLASAKERGIRTVCAGNIRQFILAAQLYAHDNNDILPRPETACTALIRKTVLTNVMRYLVETRLLDCPNLHARYVERTAQSRHGWREQGSNSAIGYHYLGGHKATPWPANGTYNITSWASPQKFGESATDDLVADLNTSYEQMTIAPHGKRKTVILDENNFKGLDYHSLIYPTQAGSAGGNVGQIGGSVNWRPIKRMTMHPGSFDWGGP